MYSETTGQIIELKGKSEFMHFRAKTHLFAEHIIFPHIIEHFCLDHLQEYTKTDK